MRAKLYRTSELKRVTRKVRNKEKEINTLDDLLRIIEENQAGIGVGKCYDKQGEYLTVEIFDSPISLTEW